MALMSSTSSEPTTTSVGTPISASRVWAGTSGQTIFT